MTNAIKCLLLTCALSMLGACTSVNNVPLNRSFWKKPEQVAVVQEPGFKPQFYPEGQQGILDLIVEDIATKNFRNYLQTLNMKWYPKLKQQFVVSFKKSGVKVKTLSEDISTKNFNYLNKNLQQYAKYDYSFLKTRIGVSKLLLISVDAAGAIRRYYGFIPLSSPKAYVSLTGRLINLKNNRILWRYTAQSTVAVAGKWDQPPMYGNFTVAFNEAVRRAAGELMQNLFSKSSK